MRNLINSRLILGHINHSLFWKNLAPSADGHKGNGGVLNDGPLKKAIVEAFGSLENLKKEFNATTAGIQGSGWGWLVRLLLCHPS
jgi:Fe-Mn family superoxide dismutase